MNECLANQGPLTLTGIEILADIREIVGNKDVTDEEIAAFMLKTKEKVEPIRQEETRQAFQRTILTTIPSSLLCCMPVNAAEAQTQTQALLQSSVGAQASAAFRLFQSYYQAHSEEVNETLEGFKHFARHFWTNVESSRSLMNRLQPILRPRQWIHMILWLCKQYPQLGTEKMLNYGHNSTEVLSSF